MPVTSGYINTSLYYNYGKELTVGLQTISGLRSLILGATQDGTASWCEEFSSNTQRYRCLGIHFVWPSVWQQA